MNSNNFAKHTLTLTIGTIISQSITALVSMALTRIYSVEAIGVWSIFISLVAVVSCVITLRYECAIVIPDDDDDAANVAILSLIILLINCVLISLIILILDNLSVIGILVAKQKYWQKILMWLPICLLGTGLFQVFNYWCVRKALFKSIAVRNIINALLSSMFEIIFGITMILGQAGVVIGSTLGTLCSGILITFICVFGNRQLFFNSINLKRIKKSFYKYKNFPLYSAAGILLNQISNTIATFILAFFFTEAIVGYYSIAQQIITLPITFVGSAIGQVLYPNVVNAAKNNKLSELIDRTFKALVNLGMVPLILIFLCAPQLCALVYGNGWQVAGNYIQILTPWIIVVFVISPLTVIFDALGKQKIFLRINAGIFFVRFIILSIGGKMLSVEQTLFLYSIVGCISFVFVGVLIFRITKYNIRNSISEVVKIVISLVCKYLLIPGVLALCPISYVVQVICCILFGILFLVFDGKKTYIELKEE